jgi:DNA uptake protein ComE-like DNA-binding protein
MYKQLCCLWPIEIDGYAKDTRKLLDQARTLIARRSRGAKGAPTTNGAAIDLNKASLSQLQSVDGITETIAIQIIDHRKSKRFESVSELIELDGVDKATLAKIRSKVTVGSAK